MTSDDKLRQAMMTSDAMEVFENDTRENYNKVVFKKNITVALLPTNGNDYHEKEGKRNRCPDMGEESLVSPDLRQWRTRQEAERERLRQLDHTPAPPERPPKKPHLRPAAAGGGLSSWRSNSELSPRRKTEAEKNAPKTAQKAKTHSGLPELGSPVTTVASWRDLHQKGARGVIGAGGAPGEGAEVKQGGAQNDAPLVVTAAGNVAAKRNFFAPQPFGKSGGGEDRAVPRLRPSRTFPQLQLNNDKSSSLSLHSGGDPTSKQRPPVGPKPAIAPKPVNLVPLAAAAKQPPTTRESPSFESSSSPSSSSSSLSSASLDTASSHSPVADQQQQQQHRARPVRVDSQLADNSPQTPDKDPGRAWQMPDIRQKEPGGAGTGRVTEAGRSDKNDNYINNNCDRMFPDTSSSQLRGQLFNGSRPANNANTAVSHQSQNSSQSSFFNHNTAVTNVKQGGGDLYPCTAGNDNRRYSLDQDALPRLRRSRRSSQEFDDLVKRKGEITKRLTNKICVMKEEKSALLEEIKHNELIGQKLVQQVSCVAQLAEIDKMKLHIAEMDKMTALLVSLSGRLARVETEMEAVAAGADTDEKKSLQRKRERLAEKLVEAKSLKDLKDKMGDKIVGMISKYLGHAELAEYDKFVINKVRLVMEMKEVVDKIRLGEEQLTALDCCSEQLIVPVTSL